MVGVRMRKRGVRGLLAGLVLSFAAAAAAQPVESLPGVLRDWVGWVREGHEFAACPMRNGSEFGEETAHDCAWPGELRVDADARGARFAQSWIVYARSAVPLPGDGDHWPQGVTANGTPVAVVAHPDDGSPVAWMEPGTYSFAGTFAWDDRPESLAIPGDVALVRLVLDGESVFPLQRDGESLWFGRAETGEKEADSLTLQAFRLLVDGVPAVLTTRVVLDVAGEGREERLGKPLPEGWLPISLGGDLPARLDPDGTLVVQVRPGSYAVTLVARATAPIAKVDMPANEAPWPTQEVWSFQAAPELRVVTATAEHAIDPSQAGVPSEWAGLPAFLLEAGQGIALDERSRGLSAQDRNRLTLNREMWLDFDDGSWTAKDTVYGQMVRDWRLDVAKPFVLTRASENGEPLLVTQGAKPDLTGVEVRQRNTSVAASARVLEPGAQLPINGWQQDFDAVTTTIHLPPGHRLWAAIGADQAPGAWIDRWNLLDVFLVAVITLLAVWLGGIALGGTVLVYLLLAYQESLAPVFTVLAVIVVALIARLLPPGKLARTMVWIRRGALLVVALWSLVFAAEQLRFALYPQLERWSAEGTLFAGPQGMQAGYAANAEPNAPVLYDQAPTDGAAPMPQAAPPPPPRPAEAMEEVVVTGSRIKRTDMETAQPVFKVERESVSNAVQQSKSKLLQRYASNTVVQAGYGDPGWGWSDYQLSWSGPVLPDQHVRLVVTPAWATRLLRVALVALLVLMLARLVRISRQTTGTAKPLGPVLAAALLLPGIASAQAIPTDELLEQLRQRVIEAPDCAPACAALASARISAADDVVRIALEYHAAERVAVPLPGADALLSVESLSVDGRAEAGVRRAEDGTGDWIVLARGVHRVDIVARAAVVEKVNVRFALAPGLIAFDGNGWDAAGIQDGRLLTDTLELTRTRVAESAAASGVAQQFPPFVQVVRSITLGIDWDVYTEVRRIAPAGDAFSIELPLLPGEQVLSSDLKVRDGRITVPFQGGAGSMSWSSRLDRENAKLVLEAPALADHAETWIVQATPMWNLRYSGVPPVYPEGAEWSHEFHPLPGEKLALDIDRPAAVQGPTLALDGVTLVATVGKRATEHTLDMDLRSTQGGQHVVTLPDGAEVLGVTMNGATINVRPEKGKLSLPIKPGSQHAQVRWRDTREIDFATRVPAVNVGAQASNINVALHLPADRWVLATGGPRVGPAVLYWGELAVMALVAWFLSRLKRTPLRFHHWLLLGIGFSMASWPALVVFVAWLFALDARGRSPALQGDLLFNLRQLGLVLLTFVALVLLWPAIQAGLLGTPDMHLVGNSSDPMNLRWFHDRTDGALPTAWAWSVPMWVYRAAMLAWALWLANALVKWLRWGWAAYTNGGHWRETAKRRPPAAAAAPADAATYPVEPAGSDRIDDPKN